MHFIKKAANKDKCNLYASAISNLFEKTKKKDLKNISTDNLFTLMTLCLFCVDSENWNNNIKYKLFIASINLAE